MSLESFEKLASVHDLTGEERSILMYRFGVGDGIVRTISEVTEIMNREHNYAEDDEYRMEDIRYIETRAILSITGPQKGA
jgi:DNA-directed RNA polymerase sigma subunit (sigma70/sigma32)